MAGFFPSIYQTGFFGGTPSNVTQIPWDSVNGVERYDTKWVGNENQVALDQTYPHMAPISAFHIESGWGQGAIQKTQSADFHYRLWVIPPVLQMTNPPLNVDIPFNVWNTSFVTEELIDLNVVGSDVLTFDFNVGDSLWDLQYRVVNMQIDSGEPSIDATVEFVTDNLIGYLKVLATISDTFNLIPDVPVKEVWEFKTDILKNYRGGEQRISLRQYPRIRQEFDVEIIDVRQRREQYMLLRKNIVVQTIIAFYQYGTKVEGLTLAGANRFYFDPARTNARVGEFMAIVNTTTEQILLGRVDIIHLDGVTMNTSASFNVDGSAQTWVAIPCFNCTVEDGSGITMQTVTGTLSIKADTFKEPTLVRPNSTRTFTTFDGIPHLDRRHFAGANEDFSHRRDVIDNETGIRDISSRDYHPEIMGTRKFIVQRNNDPEEMDYWRSLFDHLQGAQKSFLMSTYFPDLSFAPGQLPLTSGSSTFIVNEGEAKAMFTDYETWKRLEIAYSNGERTQHVITSSSVNEDGTMNVSISPAIPVGEVYRSPVQISYLMRVRASDRIAWDHFANYSEVSFGIVSTDQ